MKFKNVALNVLLITSSNLMWSQTHKFLSFPIFNETDVKKTSSLIEKDAPAEILYNIVRFNILPNQSLEKEYYSKIKIYDKNKAEEWLNLEIPMQTGERLLEFEATVYNLAGDKVEKVTVDKKDQLKENFIKGLKFYKIAFPNILNGSVIEYRYKVGDANFFNLSHVLEHNIPVVYQEFNLEYPETLAYTFNNPGNMLVPKYNISITENRSNLLYNIYRFGYENVKPVKNELFVKDLSRHKAKLKAQLAYLLTRYRSREYTYDKSKDWNNVAELLSEDDKFGGFLKSDVKGILPEEIKNYYEANERANKVFNFVKTNYKWNKQSSIIPSQNIKQLLKSKTGNSADLNLFLVMLLRNSGIEANPFLISTVDNGIFNIASIDLNSMNYALASAKINGKINLYDATSYNAKANLMRQRNWNDFGILFEKDKGTEMTFVNNNISEKKYFIQATLNPEDLEVTGNFVQEESGMYALETYEDFDFNNDKYNQSFNNKFGINSVDVGSKLLDNSNFETKLKFSSSNLLDKVGEKLIINPVLFLKNDVEIFNQVEARKYPIDFISGFVKEKRIEINIPENYKIADFPKNKKIKTDDKEIGYSYIIEEKNGKVILTTKVEVQRATYPKEFYPAFKQIWKVISDCENQVISLSKK
ncbi:DUF3857 domain-containing protein [Chryseobacterium indologenes]|uniref:DUF3857 domain-containing protein n=2 Tax=Chryseobacterium indologenes TaxID=253 RepID=UPI000B518F53|nr:DUF3857 domain-containing protein [Chryseobacterium indologenes]ASE60419.1 DUF3857 domain-containing protein [Chryseobacterium indologenes]VFA44524.1 Domain of Uncharacterised Function with PDB structure [Chryseobacterium indologenes]